MPIVIWLFELFNPVLSFPEIFIKYDFFYTRSTKLYNSIPEPLKNYYINQQYITWQIPCRSKK